MLNLPFLKPRDNKFCVLLEGLSTQARSCALHLQTFVESTQVEEQQTAAAAMAACRAQSKVLMGQVTAELCRTYITPFDREDIQDIAVDLYKIPKTIDKIRERLSAHALVSQKGDFSRQIDLIVQEAEAMEDMVRELTKGHDDKRVIAKAAQLQELEHRGDQILGELLVALFKDPSDVRDLILRKDIYDMLEKVIDRYRDAAAVALQIVLKHS
ncbi:MAG: DUF47 family protein [Alphaproteobacteria bacterium]|nr:DUF47 family protein [Alphaproteobacteria bacterium]